MDLSNWMLTNSVFASSFLTYIFQVPFITAFKKGFSTCLTRVLGGGGYVQQNRYCSWAGSVFPKHIKHKTTREIPRRDKMRGISG